MQQNDPASQLVCLLNINIITAVINNNWTKWSTILLSNHAVSNSIWNSFARVSFQKAEISVKFFKKLKFQFNYSSLENSRVQINVKLNEKKTVWLLINNTKIRAKKSAERCFLKPINSYSRKPFFRISVQKFCDCFIWDHWPKKFPIVCLQIIIHN